MSEKDCYEHYLVSGRRCGGSEDSIGYICVTEGEDPEAIFIREILYEGNLPEGWEDRVPTYQENSFGDWAVINGRIELPFGMESSEEIPRALKLDEFRFKNGRISASATLGLPS